MESKLSQIVLTEKAKAYLRSVRAGLSTLLPAVDDPVLIITFPVWEEAGNSPQRIYSSSNGLPLVRLGAGSAKEFPEEKFLADGIDKIFVRTDQRIANLAPCAIDFDGELFLISGPITQSLD